VVWTLESKDDRGSYVIGKGITKLTSAGEEMPVIFFSPKADWNGTAVLWLTGQQLTEPTEAMQKLLAAGFAVGVPQLYLPGVEKAPWNPVKDKNQANHEGPFWAPCFTYGYNHPLVVQRVHDAMTMVVMMQNHKLTPKRIVLAGSGDMAPVAALAAAAMKDVLDAAVIDTKGFRFAKLRDVQDPDFVPGAVKYGDLFGILNLVPKDKLHLVGELAKGGDDELAELVLKVAK
jgi:hypothetical protein